MAEIEALRLAAITAGQVGVHPLGLRPGPGMSAFSGDAAIAELDRDLKKLGSGSSKRQSKKFKSVAASYRTMIHAALALHPQAVLANAGCGYDSSFRQNGFLHDCDGYYVMAHTVYVPFLPGGYMRLRFELEGFLSSLIVDFNSWQDYFPGDIAGHKADGLEHNDRNLQCKRAIDKYLLDVLNAKDAKTA